MEVLIINHVDDLDIVSMFSHLDQEGNEIMDKNFLITFFFYSREYEKISLPLQKRVLEDRLSVMLYAI